MTRDIKTWTDAIVDVDVYEVEVMSHTFLHCTHRRVCLTVCSEVSSGGDLKVANTIFFFLVLTFEA